MRICNRLRERSAEKKFECAPPCAAVYSETDLAANVKKAGECTLNAHEGCFVNSAYKMYVPAPRLERPQPLVMMLHGCRQNPDDFAARTRRYELAEVHGFLVPSQLRRHGQTMRTAGKGSGLSSRREAAEPLQFAGIVGASSS